MVHVTNRLILCVITQMAEQLVTTGHVDERELQGLNLKQVRMEIGQCLLNYSGKYGFVCMTS